MQRAKGVVKCGAVGTASRTGSWEWPQPLRYAALRLRHPLAHGEVAASGQSPARVDYLHRPTGLPPGHLSASQRRVLFV